MPAGERLDATGPSQADRTLSCMPTGPRRKPLRLYAPAAAVATRSVNNCHRIVRKTFRETGDMRMAKDTAAVPATAAANAAPSVKPGSWR